MHLQPQVMQALKALPFRALRAPPPVRNRFLNCVSAWRAKNPFARLPCFR